jgi:hypothetical protein
MTTTTAGLPSGRADDNGPTQNADPPTGSRMLSSRPGRCFILSPDPHGWLTKGFDSAYDGRPATSGDYASRD